MAKFDINSQFNLAVASNYAFDFKLNFVVTEIFLYSLQFIK